MKNVIPEKGAVYFSNKAWKNFLNYLDNREKSKVFILVDTNTKQQCLPYFLSKCESLQSPEIITIPDGEKFKNITTCVNVWEMLAAKNADRKSVIINLGGGVVTDLGGFVASTYKRGIPFIYIPTTLLAMVDASVGGKNGVDLGYIKNQIGVVNLPDLVVIDPKFLQTLPQEHIFSGFAEMLKHGLIYSETYWDKLKNIDFNDSEMVTELIKESVVIKNKIVKQDPLEQNIRKTLNFGHTLGHAIESYSLESKSRNTLLHGEAIAIGMILESYIATKLLNFPETQLKDVSKTIFRYFKKVKFSEKDISEIINLLAHDKKNFKGAVLFVLLTKISEPKINCKVANRLIYNAFEYYENF
tara:strand:+ start:62 stop:1132 length:1071 start_codon:yes stop_codon:yes gene_type:complete